MTNATPRPWKIWDSSGRDIEDSNGNLIGTAYPDEKDLSYTSEIAKANAKLIVTAVNSYDALVEACEYALGINKQSLGHVVHEKLVKALKLTKGE